MRTYRPVTPVVHRRTGDSTHRGSRGQRLSCGHEDVLERVLRCQQQAHAPRVAYHRGADLQQLDPDSGRARALDFGALQPESAKVDLHKAIGLAWSNDVLIDEVNDSESDLL